MYVLPNVYNITSVLDIILPSWHHNRNDHFLWRLPVRILHYSRLAWVDKHGLAIGLRSVENSAILQKAASLNEGEGRLRQFSLGCSVGRLREFQFTYKPP